MKSTDYKIINRQKRRYVALADAVLGLGRSMRMIRRSPAVPPDLTDPATAIRRILLIRLAYIGDTVLTQPVIAPIRSAFPEARIDFLTSRAAAPLLDSDPGLDAVIPFNAPWFYPEHPWDDPGDLMRRLRGQYDLGIDFRGDIRNIWHCLYRPGIPHRLSYDSGGGGALLTHPVEWSTYTHKVTFHLDILRQAGIRAPDADPRIHLSENEIAAMRRTLDALPGGCAGKRPIAIHPGSRLPLKRWPVDRFVELIQRINDADAGPVILLEAPGKTSIPRAVSSRVPVAADLTGRLSIREMAAMLHHCRLLVCHDSAPMHIAAAVGCRVTALFGPSRPLETAPCGEGHRIIEAACSHKDRCDENRCVAPHRSGCMNTISAETVFQAVREQSNGVASDND